MAGRPNWYGEHPPACTCVDCTERRRTGRKPPPKRKPRPGYRWEFCPTCNGAGAIIGRWGSELGGRMTRCPRCFRVGWVETPVKSPRKEQDEGKREPSEEAKRTAESVLEWLAKAAEEEEKPPAPPGQGETERNIHGKNCNCKACKSLRRGYAKAKRRKAGGFSQFPRAPHEKRWRVRFRLLIGITIIVAVLGLAAASYFGMLDRFLDEGNGIAAPFDPTPAPTRVTAPQATPTSTPFTSISTPIPTPLPMAQPTPSPLPMPTAMPIRPPTMVPTSVVNRIPTATPVPIPAPTLVPVPIPVPTPEPVPLPTPEPTSEPTPEPTPVVEQDFRVNRLTEEEMVGLREYALDLINIDRVKHGVGPVVLGNNPAAQMHAEDMLEHDYQGHWWVDGRKPYMVYSATGGTSYATENVASWGWTETEWRSDNCDSYLVRCRIPSPSLAIREHQWTMMYDDAYADWGHRDNILEEGHRAVNVGIAFDNRRVTFIQHFEGGDVQAAEPPTLAKDGTLTLSMQKNVEGLDILDSIAVFHDPLPELMTPEEIDALDSYCIGGGATTRCGDPIAYVLEPPPPGWYYDLAPKDVIADTWEDYKNSLRVIANIAHLATSPGVYTVVVWGEVGNDLSTEMLLELSLLSEQ